MPILLPLKTSTLLFVLLVLCSNLNYLNAQQDAIGPFQLRLYWTPESCWQGDCNQPNSPTGSWCIQCEGKSCNWGDILWIEPCRDDLPDQQLFRWIPIPIETSRAARGISDNDNQVWGQLQVREITTLTGTDSLIDLGTTQITYVFCLERIRSAHHELRECNAGRQSQWLRGLHNITATTTTEEQKQQQKQQQQQKQSPFELYPSPKSTDEDDIHSPFIPGSVHNDNCINMHHHPRHFEEIIHTTCSFAREVHTNLWETVMMQEDMHSTLTTAPPGENELHVATVLQAQEAPILELFQPKDYYNLGRPREDPRCWRKATCGMCEGDCRTDQDCAGSLKCFVRTSENPTETPPGCFGPGIPRVDYCYAEDGN